jgi:hypothetical protein
VLTIALAVACLLLTTVPLTAEGTTPPPALLLDGVFYGLLGLTALMVGAFAVVLTSLTATITDVLGSLPQAVVEEILDETEGGADLGERTDESAPRRDTRTTPSPS